MSDSNTAWVPVGERLPESGMPVLLDIGKEYPLRAMWVAKHTLEVGLDGPEDWGDYDEEADVYYCLEGWYEWNRHEETHWRVIEPAIHWMPLPETPALLVEIKE